MAAMNRAAEAQVGDREVLHRPRRLRAVVRVGRDLHLAHRVFFGAEFVGHAGDYSPGRDYQAWGKCRRALTPRSGALDDRTDALGLTLTRS